MVLFKFVLGFHLRKCHGVVVHVGSDEVLFASVCCLLVCNNRGKEETCVNTNW